MIFNKTTKCDGYYTVAMYRRKGYETTHVLSFGYQFLTPTAVDEFLQSYEYKAVESALIKAWWPK